MENRLVIPTIIWGPHAERFLDVLTDWNSNYFEIELAIEHVLRSEADKVSISFLVREQTVYLHRTPPFMDLPELYVIFMKKKDGHEIELLTICLVEETLH